MHLKRAGKIVALTGEAPGVGLAAARGSRRVPPRRAEASMTLGAEQVVRLGEDGALQRELRDVDAQLSSNAAA